MESNNDINIALLIDADNITAKYTESILSELSKYGKVTYRRMYGDWSQGRLKSWLSAASKHSLTPIMQPNNTPGKNASDIGLIIDAMDILYSGEVDGFCIASSDGDFNKLATRLREAGKIVIGMGEKKTPASFRASCERFVFLDMIHDEEDEEETTTTTAKNGEKTAGPVDRATIENAIINMIADNESEGRETGLGELGSRLVKIYPDFDIRNYNYSRMSAFVKSFSSLSVTTRDSQTWVSLKASSVKEIEAQILKIFDSNRTDTMNIGLLKNELEKVNPNLNATIKKNGFTKFSVFLEKKISSVRVESGTNAVLK